MKFDPSCRYDEEHEWIRVEGDEGVIALAIMLRISCQTWSMWTCPR